MAQTTKVLAPIEPTAEMLRAGAALIGREGYLNVAKAIWTAMIDARPAIEAAESRSLSKVLRDVKTRASKRRGADELAYAVVQLPAVGSTRRNPAFWSDMEVRRLVIETHRQMTMEEARAAIAEVVGDARTPSKSALARVWLRLDKAGAR